ncbi:MAG: fimbria/pilus outer membrane usher protein [Rhodoferax sp.]|nr:fimbria/pilus outer membrane usher protein [Rhodoferax sp.]
MSAGASDANLAGPRGHDVYLELSLNGSARGLVHFGERGGELWAGASTLRQLGFVLPAGTPDPVRLSTLPGLQVHYDVASQSVDLMAPLALLSLPKTVLGAPGIAEHKASTVPGLLLNYDLYGTRGQGTAASLNAFTELRAFNAGGVFSSTALSQQTRADGGNWQANSVRLDTSWSTSWPDKLLTLNVGDTLTDALSWSRATRIGGIQLGSNFALQPYQITTPVPALLGSATLPSQVDLYVNGMRQYNGQVPAGPFQLNTIPNITGAGNAQVVLTDAFGRATTLNFSLYGTQQLLKQGLSQWSVELGKVRENYGLSSFDYGNDPVASGTWRHGVTNSFTLETHAEATSGLTTAGVGGYWQPGQAGVFSGALATSRNSGRQAGMYLPLAASGGDEGSGGSQLNLGYQWNNSQFNAGFNATHTYGNYLDVASLYGGAPPTSTGNAVVGYNTRRWGGFSLSYIYQQYPGQNASRYASASWFKSLGRSTSITVSANQDLVDHSQRSIAVVLTWVLDSRTTVSTSAQRSNGSTTYTANASSSTPSEGGFGWSAGLRQGGGQNGGQGEVDYLGRYGRVDAGVYDVAGNHYGYAEANGALVFMGGHPFAARQITNAFALVSTDGVAGVPVLLENRPIGTTDGSGLLLVTPLNSYQNNQVGIDPMQLPADVRIDSVKTIATPSDRAGTLVRFGITPIRAASVILVDASAQPLPLGSLVRVNAQPGEPALVGYDGEVYLDTLAAHNVLQVDTPAGACHASFDYHSDAGGSIPQIGPLRCMKEVSP